MKLRMEEAADGVAMRYDDYQRRFETERLIIRAIEASDGDSIFFAYSADPDVARYMTYRCTGNIEDTRAFVREACAVWNGTPGRCDYVVLLKANCELIGAISFEPRGHQAAVGYNYAKKHWGKGYASEALEALTDYVLNLPGMFRVWAVHDIDNPASGRVMEKCGFKREGMLERGCLHPNVSPEPRTAVLWAKTR